MLCSLQPAVHAYLLEMRSSLTVHALQLFHLECTSSLAPAGDAATFCLLFRPLDYVQLQRFELLQPDPQHHFAFTVSCAAVIGFA